MESRNAGEPRKSTGRHRKRVCILTKSPGWAYEAFLRLLSLDFVTIDQNITRKNTHFEPPMDFGGMDHRDEKSESNFFFFKPT